MSVVNGLGPRRRRWQRVLVVISLLLPTVAVAQEGHDHMAIWSTEPAGGLETVQLFPAKFQTMPAVTHCGWFATHAAPDGQ